MRAKVSVRRSREIATATTPTTRLAPNIWGRLSPLANPAMKTKAAIERFMETGCLVNRDRPKENGPVVIQVMKNQLLASGPPRQLVSTPA